MKTVYIVQKPDEKKNILSAKDFGEFKFVFPEKLNLIWRPEETVSIAKKELRYFNDQDHLLLIGDPALIGICTAVAADYNRGKVKFLKWDNREFKYYPVEVEL
jgi:hypothetical protein|tara:strand:+ start:21499 stop:21807 length:309 start_codon:yes stop_codon:yes gene_type:complete